MWTVIYVTKDISLADKIKSEFENNNILFKIRNVSNSQDGDCYEILVPESEIDKAHDIIINIGI